MIFIISKIVNAFLLPPGLFVTILLLAAYFVRQGKKALLALALILWFFSSYIGARLLIKPLEQMQFPASNKKAEAVVVLGGGKVSDEPYLALSSMGTKRLLRGLTLAMQNNLPLIYSGYENGYAKKTLLTLISSLNLPMQECNYLQEGCFIIEGESKDTYENAKLTKELFKKLGVVHPRIILVTSAYHMPRSYKLFHYFGFDIIPKKCDYKLDSSPTLWAILPRLDNLIASYDALHEYLGLLSLIFRGIR